jgi:phytoene desaturase
VYAVITYMDTVRGVVAAEGGMHAVPRALAAAASGAGVKFHYDTRVERILLRDGATGPVVGVELAGGERIATDVVVANPDLPVAYDTLLPGLRAPRAARRGRFSPSAVVWHAGGRVDLPPGVAQHNIHFGRGWDASFHELIDDGTRMSDPSMLVTVPTLDDGSLAPPGRHVVYALEPVPNLDGRIDWAHERSAAREQLVERVAATGYAVDVEVEEFVDPSDWQRRGMAKGTPFALAHRFFQSGPFRPGNVERRAPGLVFVGSGTVPGVGVPMVLISGRLAAQRVAELRGRR